MAKAIEKARAAGETLGGLLEVFVCGLPAGLGSHVNWDRRLDARLAQAVMGMNAIKGVEIGDAFDNRPPRRHAAHDAIRASADGTSGAAPTAAAASRAAFPTASPLAARRHEAIPTTRKGQDTVDLATGKPALTYYERSDVCPVPRAVIVLESVVAHTVADALLEKLGGDSLEEMRPRFEALRSATLDDLRMTGQPHVFWP
jgi:chorismate synthase